MAPLTEQNHMAEFMISEGPHYRARDVGNVVGGDAPGLAAGTVLGKITANGNYAPYDPAAGDGTESVAAVLFQEVVGTEKRTIIVRSAEVKASKLTWKDGMSGAEIDTGTAELEALGIIVR